MPLWGWIIIAVVVIIVLPLKLNLYKKILENKKKKEESIEEDI